MKTLKNKKGDKFVRVPDKKPNEIEGILDLLEKGWQYCSKTEWKEKARDVALKTQTKKPKKKVKKAKKRKSQS